MNKINSINQWMAGHMTLLILLGLLLGVAFPSQMALLTPFVGTMMALQTFCNSLGGGIRDLIRVVSHPKPVLLTLGVLHILMPLIALGIGSLLFPQQPLYTLSIVLVEASPAAVSSLIWAVIGGGNVELCLSIILLDTFLSPVVLPLTLRLLCGSVVEFNTMGMVRDLLFMVVLPAALSMLLYQFAGRDFCTKLKSRVSIFPKLMLIFIVAANITRCTQYLFHLNGTLVLLLCVSLFLRILGLFIGFWLSRLTRLSYATGLTVTLNSSMRNNAAASTLAAEYFPAEAVFSPAISPVFSQVCVSIAVKFLQRGRPAESDAQS